MRDRLEAAINGFYSEMGIFESNGNIRIAGAALQSMKKHLGQYKRYIRQAEEMHMPSIVDSFDEAIDVTYWQDWIMETQRKIRIIKGP